MDDVALLMTVQARRALECRAAQLGCALRDLGCTLIAIAVKRGRACAAHIGDGAAVVRTTDGRLELLSGPAESEYVNEVDPLTSPHWERAVRVSASTTGVQDLAVFTDGLQRAALRFGQPHDGFLGPILNHVRAGGTSAGLEALLGGPKLSEHSEDDKTLVVAGFG